MSGIVAFGTQLLGLEYSFGQAAVLRASRGERLTEAESSWLTERAGISIPCAEREPPDELALLSGRQSGKSSYIGSTLALYVAFDPATSANLGPGEHCYVMVIAPTTTQAGIIYRRLCGLIQNSSLAKELAKPPTQSEIELKSGVILAIRPANSATVRGFPLAAVVLDEAAYFAAEGSRADAEIVRALRPAMAHFPGAQICSISTPWTREGRMWDTYRRRAEMPEVLCVQVPSWELHPDFPQKVLEREKRRDLDNYRREFAAEFVESIDTYLPLACIETCIQPGRTQVPPRDGVQYAAALDQGYRQDSFVLGIAHAEDETVVVDHLREWKPRPGNPVKPAQVIPEIRDTLRRYRTSHVCGDQFSVEAFKELLAREGLAYVERTFTGQSKPQFFGSLKDLIVEGRIELLDHEASLRELRLLEAKRLPTGNVKIEAPGRAHDDHADVLALLAHELRPSNQIDYGQFGWIA